MTGDKGDNGDAPPATTATESIESAPAGETGPVDDGQPGPVGAGGSSGSAAGQEAGSGAHMEQGATPAEEGPGGLAGEQGRASEALASSAQQEIGSGAPAAREAGGGAPAEQQTGEAPAEQEVGRAAPTEQQARQEPAVGRSASSEEGAGANAEVADQPLAAGTVRQSEPGEVPPVGAGLEQSAGIAEADRAGVLSEPAADTNPREPGEGQPAGVDSAQEWTSGRLLPLRDGPENGVLVKRDSSDNITNYAEYDSSGLITKRVDLTGKSHGDIPTPHTVEYTRDVAPDGRVFPRELKVVRPATPEEVP